MAETVEANGATPAEEEPEPSATDLLEQLGRDAGVLAFYETRLAASRHKPELRQGALGIAALAVAAVAFLTAFALANVAAVQALSGEVADWVAPLVLAAAWAGLGLALALVLQARARRARVWRL